MSGFVGSYQPRNEAASVEACLNARVLVSANVNIGQLKQQQAVILQLLALVNDSSHPHSPTVNLPGRARASRR
jgi:hypothetical protein